MSGWKAWLPAGLGGDTGDDRTRRYRHHDGRELDGGSDDPVRLDDLGAPLLSGQTSQDDGPVRSDNPDRGESGAGGAFLNMTNSIVGAGIIGQPYALRQSGIATGLVLMAVLAILVDWTIRLVVTNSKLAGATSLHETVERCYGRGGRIGIAAAQWLFAFGGIVAFTVIVADSIPPVVAAVWPGGADSAIGWIVLDRRAVTFLCVTAVSLPLALRKSIAGLAAASGAAVVSMGIVIAAVVVRGMAVPKDLRGSLSGLWIVNDGWGIIRATGVISFAFVCHHNSTLIFRSLRTPTLDRFARVTHAATGLSLAASALMALAGVLVFGDKAQGNVLNNFPKDDLIVNIARVCFALNMLTTIPLEAVVCRDIFDALFPPSPTLTDKQAWIRHVGSTTVHLLVASVIGLSVCDLGPVLEVVGATSGAAIAYVLPPICFLHLTPAAAAAAAALAPAWRWGGWVQVPTSISSEDESGHDADLQNRSTSTSTVKPTVWSISAWIEMVGPRMMAVVVAVFGVFVGGTGLLVAIRGGGGGGCAS